MRIPFIASVVLLVLLAQVCLVTPFEWPEFIRDFGKPRTTTPRPPELSPKVEIDKLTLIKNLFLLAAKFNIKEYFDREVLKGIIRNSFIPTVPGTLWCGHGDIAMRIDMLGRKKATDSCCRAHDLCDDIMKGDTSKHGLTNTAAVTRLHCDCDAAFYHCLKDVEGDDTAKLVGEMFFNVIRTPCYKEEYPVIGCIRRSPKYKKCVGYRLDKYGRKKYQWFDNPEF